MFMEFCCIIVVSLVCCVGVHGGCSEPIIMSECIKTFLDDPQ